MEQPLDAFVPRGPDFSQPSSAQNARHRRRESIGHHWAMSAATQDPAHPVAPARQTLTAMVCQVFHHSDITVHPTRIMIPLMQSPHLMPSIASINLLVIVAATALAQRGA